MMAFDTGYLNRSILLQVMPTKDKSLCTKPNMRLQHTTLVEGGINHVLSAGALRIMQQARVALLCTDFRLLDRWMDMIDIGLVLFLE
jgi:hypothetical protein